jgi:hypothetical protein
VNVGHAKNSSFSQGRISTGPVATANRAIGSGAGITASSISPVFHGRNKITANKYPAAIAISACAQDIPRTIAAVGSHRSTFNDAITWSAKRAAPAFGVKKPSRNSPSNTVNPSAAERQASHSAK